MIYHMFDTSSAHHLSQDLWLSGLFLQQRLAEQASPTLGQQLTQHRGIVFFGDHPSLKTPCEMSEPHYLWSPHNCWWRRCWWRGRGPGWVQGYDVLMSSVIFLYTGVIHHVTSQPSSTPLCHAVLWSSKTRWHKDSSVSGCSGCSCVMSSFSTTSPRDTIENIRHFLSDESRLILSAQTFYKNTHFYCWKN